jgi:hypothetical protein
MDFRKLKPCLYLLEQSHPVHSPLQTDLPSTSTVQDPSFRQGLGEQGLTEILSFYINILLKKK